MNRLFAKGRAWGIACLTGLALALPALAVPGAAGAADVALVIGNHDYRSAPDAMSARRDAEAVADTLRQSGYEVISGMDLTRSAMRSQIARLAGRIGDADRLVVFYSGHALRTGGASYLAPVDQGNDSLVEVMMDGVPLELVLRLAGEASGQAVVFIDGAQLDGFTPRDFAEPGLAHIDPPDGVLVVSAAAPGRAIPRRSERRSDFARQVIEAFLAPGNRIGNAVRGLASPGWVAGDTDSSLVLVPSDRGQASAGAGTGSGSGSGSGTDSGTGSGTAGASPSEVEARLRLSATERRSIQQSLVALGYDTRGTDGIFGRGTRSAIRGWQRANDLEATGYLTADQVTAINRQGRQAADRGPTPSRVEARLNLTASERSEIQEHLTMLGHDTRGTGGTFGSGTRSAIRTWQRANDFEETGYLTSEQVVLIDRQASRAGSGTGATGRPNPSQVEDRLNLTAIERSTLQENLTRLGYDTRGTGGTFGSGTRTAIRNWQRANDFEETGYLTSQQVAMINRQARQAGTGTGTGTGGPSPAEIEARLNLTGAERSQIQEDLSLLGYDTRGSDGVFGSATRNAIRNWQRANGFDETGYLNQAQLSQLAQQTRQAGTPPTGGARPAPDNPSAAEAALGLTRNDRLSVEQRLAYLGFPPGEQDGFFDADTRWAIEGYQRSRGYPATGYLDRQTIAGIVDETQDARSGIVTGAQVLFDILRGLGGGQQ